MIPSERDKLTRNILKHYQAIKREVEEADEEFMKALVTIKDCQETS